MQITERVQNGITVLVLDGRIDSDGATALDSALRTAVAEGKVRLVLELSQVPYVNSAVLRTLADIIIHCRDKGGDMKLAGLQPKVRRVLQIVGFDRFSSIHDTLEDALRDF